MYQQPDQASPAVPNLYPRWWVIVFSILGILTCFGMITAIPLLVTESKGRPDAPPNNKAWLVITAVWVGLVLVIWIGSLAIGRSNQAISSHGVKTTEGPTTEKKDIYATGETVQLKGHTISVKLEKIGYQSTNMFDKPSSSSNEYVVVAVEIANTGSSELIVNSFGFSLEDDTGTTRDTAFIAGLDNQLESVTLQPGGHTTGMLCFEAKKGSKTLILHYTGNLHSGGCKIKLK